MAYIYIQVKNYQQKIFILTETIFYENTNTIQTHELEGRSLNEENKELSEMENFQNMKKKYFKNPLMGYLNINSLTNKIIVEKL